MPAYACFPYAWETSWQCQTNLVHVRLISVCMSLMLPFVITPITHSHTDTGQQNRKKSATLVCACVTAEQLLLMSNDVPYHTLKPVYKPLIVVHAFELWHYYD